ncbi:MAG TPA: hypothetical protein GX735_04275 [Firmicutes bacterium]|jgi:cobalt/nickel transport system permease protein|nr:hypothetical protein [Bacillota bacterium]
MDLALIDNYAHRGKTPLHRASPIGKVFLTCVLLLGVIRARTYLELTLLFCCGAVALFLSRFPFTRLLPFLFLPAFFGTVFAAGGSGAGPPLFLIMGKAVTAALSLLLLLLTTPLPRLMGLLRVVLPGFLADAFFITYRSFFLLWGSLENLLLIYKMRGGYSSRALFTNLLHLGPVLGVLVLHALDSMERFSWVLALRGGSASLGGGRVWEKPNRYDLYPLLLGIILLVVVL